MGGNQHEIEYFVKKIVVLYRKSSKFSPGAPILSHPQGNSQIAPLRRLTTLRQFSIVYLILGVVQNRSANTLGRSHVGPVSASVDFRADRRSDGFQNESAIQNESWIYPLFKIFLDPKLLFEASGGFKISEASRLDG